MSRHQLSHDPHTGLDIVTWRRHRPRAHVLLHSLICCYLNCILNYTFYNFCFPWLVRGKTGVLSVACWSLLILIQVIIHLKGRSLCDEVYNQDVWVKSEKNIRRKQTITTFLFMYLLAVYCEYSEIPSNLDKAAPPIWFHGLTCDLALLEKIRTFKRFIISGSLFFNTTANAVCSGLVSHGPISIPCV